MDQGEWSQGQGGGGECSVDQVRSKRSCLRHSIIPALESQVTLPRYGRGDISNQRYAGKSNDFMTWKVWTEGLTWKTLWDAQLSPGIAQISEEEVGKKATKPGSCSKAWFGNGFPVVPGLSGVEIIRLFFSVKEKSLALTSQLFSDSHDVVNTQQMSQSSLGGEGGRQKQKNICRKTDLCVTKCCTVGVNGWKMVLNHQENDEFLLHALGALLWHIAVEKLCNKGAACRYAHFTTCSFTFLYFKTPINQNVHPSTANVMTFPAQISIPPKFRNILRSLCVSLLWCCRSWTGLICLKEGGLSPLILVTPSISRCKHSCMEKYKRQDDLALWMTLFSLVDYGEAQQERLALRDEETSNEGDVACGTFHRFLNDPSENCVFFGGKEVHQDTLGCILHGMWW